MIFSLERPRLNVDVGAAPGACHRCERRRASNFE
jgi:hypothetical protein